MNVLILSQESWKDSVNGGNVLSNLFGEIPDIRIAQIFCSAELPNNNLCERYLQFTDFMMLKNIIHRKPVGNIFGKRYYRNDLQCEKVSDDKKFYGFFQKHNFEIFYFIQEYVWKCGGWKNDKLLEFVENFKPDFIFMPCYGKCFMLDMALYVKSVANVPIISYIWDDVYSLQQFRISIFYWINRCKARKHIRKFLKQCSLVYTMTEQQKAELEKEFPGKLKILRKGIDCSNVSVHQEYHKPIQMIYAGNIYVGRYNTLKMIADCVKMINVGERKLELHIYTNNVLSGKQQQELDNHAGSYVHRAVPYQELIKIYQNSDIALHVEGMDRKNKLITRLSFSTKITDCLGSGCMIMAVAWEEQAGLQYLKEHDAAICVSDKNQLLKALKDIVENPDIIKEYSQKAYICLERNHSRKSNNELIENDLQRIIS